MNAEEFKANAIELLKYFLETSKKSVMDNNLEDDVASKNYHQGIEDAIKMIETLGFH